MRRINKFKKIAAAVMAAVLAITAIPVMGLASANAEDAAATSTLNFDLSELEIPKNDDGTYGVLEKNANFLAGDVEVLATSSKTVKVESSEGVANEKGVVYSRKLNLSGTGAADKRAVKLVLPTESKVTVWALSGSDKDVRTLRVMKDGTEEVATVDVAVKGTTVVNGETLSLSAGTYYIWSKSSGINIYDIDIQWSLGFDMSGLEIPKNDDGTYGVLEKGENFFAGAVEVLATSSKTVKVESSEGIANEDGKVYAKKLNLSGTGAADKRAVKVVLPHSAEVTVWALSGSDKDVRTLRVMKDGTDEVATIDVAVKGTSVINGATLSLDAGTYYIWSKSSGINIYDIDAKYAPDLDLSAYKESTEIEAETVVGDFTLIAGTAEDNANITVDVPEGVADASGVAFTQRIKLNGTGSATKRAVKFTLNYKTSLDIYALSGSTDARTLNIVDASGKVVATVAAIDKNTTVVPAQTVKLAPGTYTIYSAGKGINILDIRRTPDAVQCDWSEVETPVINNVTVNESNGNFVIDFTGKADKYEGADYIMISMVSNGYEVASYKVIGKATSVEMTPYWDGDYSFTATAVRSGEAHKVSSTFEVKDFKLRLKAPVYRMFESIGDGNVYIDWVDNEYADVYEVYYKLSTDTDDKYVAVTKDLKEGNIALSGLTVGSTYTVKVVAKSTQSGLSSAYADDITVTAKGEKVWYAATTGSNQTVDMTITTADGTVVTRKFDVQDQSTDKTSWAEVPNVSNTTGKIDIAYATNGKISDDEDGFRYYYTMVNPNKENFKITATFKLTDVRTSSEPVKPDNQTGFGIMASDILGVNWFGDGSYVHKYHNSLAVGHWSSKQANATLRWVTGYNSGDASNADTAERVNNKSAFNTAVEYVQGNTYTFTLEKTNEKFIGTFNGQSLELADTSILSVQEDGSMCIGVYSARKIGVEITDIKFETSESTGVTGGNKSTAVEPSTRVYSTNTVGTSTYELIYTSNVAGTLAVTGPDGKTYPAVTMTSDSVARVNVAVVTGSNTIKTKFIPNKDAELTSYDAIDKEVTVTCKQVGSALGAIYVSPTGTADGAGTKESPMDLAEVVKYATPGQVIVMMDGEYTKAIKIPRSVSGTADMKIVLMAENTGKAVFTGGAGLGIEGSYWHVYGINTVGASGVGIQVYGNYNIVEMCVVSGSGNSGIQVSRSGSATNKQGIEGLLWPSYNLIKNCESFDNCDAAGNDADGFAAKLTCGEGNKFYGCSAHNNIDDGWDLFAKTVSGEIGAVVIENCIAYDNGWLTTKPGEYSSEGNGFKLGGGYLAGGHILKNSIAFNNHGKGITSNSCPDVEIYNCISYNNQVEGDGKGYNVGLNAKASASKEWKVNGLISMNVPANTKTADLISFALQSDKNFIYDGKVSFNVDGIVAEDSWFVSVDVSKKPTRNENGTINMAGLLELTADAQTARPGVGAVLDVTSDAAISVAPTIPESIPEETPEEKPEETPEEKPEETSNDIIPSGDEKSDVTGVVKSDDLEIVDAEGTVVDDEDIYMNVVVADDSVVTKFEDAFKANKVAISDKAKINFYDISLACKDGRALTIKSGKLYVTFAYPEGTAMDTHDFTVYHLNGDKLEKVSIECTDKGITMAADGFSPYAVVYEAKAKVPAGDDNNALPFAIAMMASMAALAGAAYYYKKRRIFG